MTKLSMEHVNAICHAELFVDAACGKIPEPRLRRSLETDLLRLTELKLYIIEKMVNPQLPFDQKPGNNGNAGT